MKAGRPVIDFIKLGYLANRSTLMEGPHGVGKSELLQQATDELSIDIIVRDLSLLEPPDLLGLPRSDNGVTVYDPPAWLPTEGRGLIVFEELNRAPRYVRSPCLQLLTARSLNDYRLPPGWVPAAAINPSDGGYDVDELDEALLSRFDRATVTANRNEWIRWAKANGIHPTVVAYVESDPQIFKNHKSNPRAWKYVSDVLWAWSNADGQFSQAVLREHVKGLVGDERSGAFVRFMRRPELPLTHSDVFDAYRKHQLLVQGWVAKGQLDLVQASLDKILQKLQSPTVYQEARQGKGWNHIRLFIADLPPDLRENAEEFFTERGYEVPR